MGSAKGKNILVIGGGSGMGASTSLLLAEKGAKVVIAGRTEATLSRVAQAAPKTMPVLAQRVDVSSRESLDRLFTWFDDSVGKLDVLVNAAGINIPNRSFNQLSNEDWDQVLRTNLTGAFDVMRLALNRMRPRKDCLLYTSPSPRDRTRSRMPSSA